MALKNYAKLDFNGYVIDVVGVKEECAPTPEVGKQFLQSTFKYDHWQYSDNSHISTTAVIGRKWYPEEGVFKGDKEDGYDSWVWSDEQWTWVAPVPYPANEPGDKYMWDEAAHQADNTTGWVEDPNWDGL